MTQGNRSTRLVARLTWSFEQLTSHRPSSDGMTPLTHSACPENVRMQYLALVSNMSLNS
jgi:hypothetical protein